MDGSPKKGSDVMATKSAEHPTRASQTERGYLTCAFDEISKPGTYVCNWSGHLLRVPPDSLKEGRSPTMEIVADEDVVVTRISENPYIPLTKARMIAADLDLDVNF
jgi:hypothetical protein